MSARLNALAIALTLVAGIAFAQESEKVTLKQVYSPGEYEIAMNMKTDGLTNVTVGATTQPAMAQKQTMTMTASMSISKPDKDGFMNASITYRRIVSNMTVASMSMTFDSDDPNSASGPLGAAMKPLVGAKISFRTTPDGNTTDVKGLAEIWDAMAKDNPGMASTAESMKKEFGDEQLKQMMRAAAGYLPAGPVAVGEAWKNAIKMPMPMFGEMAMEANCKLANIEKAAGATKAMIDFDMAGKVDKPTEKKIGDATMTISLFDIHQKGRLTFDMAVNMITAIKTTGDVLMEMTTAGPDNQKANVSSKQTVETDVTVTRAK